MALSLIRASVSSSSDSYLGQGGIITALWFFNQSHGTMTHFVVYDALTGGNLLMYGELSASRRVEAATIMTIKLGSLNLSVVNPTA